MFTKDLQELKSKQTEMSNIVKRSEVAQSCLTLCNPMDCQAPPSMGFSRQEYWSGLQGINSRITEAEEQINDLEDRMVEITVREQNIEKRMKRNEDSLTNLGDNIKRTNICIIGIPEGKERKNMRKYLKS